ncbi:HisA/HisF-related TIM barrel protein [Aurantivibrio infirmus]
MLKVRLIPCIITKNDLVVQSFGFKKYLPIGSLKTAIEFFVNWDVDEIIIIDIDAYREKRKPNFSLVEWAGSECFVPLTVGGGISELDDIRRLLNAGADKVCLNTVAFDSPQFVRKAASVFGSQCITVSIDVKKVDGDYFVYNHISQNIERKSPADYAEEMEKVGAGEIFLNSVDRDGSREGYDLNMIKSVTSRLSIPVIACGGVGNFKDLPDGINIGGCQAVAAANIFQHTEHSTIAAKAHLISSGIEVRLSSNVKYKDFKFDFMGRPY